MASSRKRQHGPSSDSKSSKKVKVEVFSEEEDDYDYDEDDYYDEEESEVTESSEEEYVPTAKAGKSPRKSQTSPKKKGKAERKVRVASKAEILSLASDVPLEAQSAKDRLSSIDNAVISRIKKALSLGTHEGTGEAEAKAAMRLAAKLMAQHNVDQADILAAEDSTEQLKRAGQSTVTIRSTSGNGGRVMMHSWTTSAAVAIETYFDCKHYTQSYHYRLDFTFYGLAEQTVAAGYAFEMVYNLILTWSAQNKAAKGRTGKNNYCFGVADGLLQMARRDRKEEEQRALKKEKARLALAAKAEEEERKKELERLADAELGPKPKVEVINVKEEDAPESELYPLPEEANDRYSSPEEDLAGMADSDDDGDDGFLDRDDFQDQADFDDEEEEDMDEILRELDATGRIKVEPRSAPAPAPKPEPVEPKVKLEEEEETPWTSAGQLTLFRNNAEAIADEYLKTSKIKLVKGHKQTGPNFSKGGYGVYLQGKEDAKKIDVKRKRIKASEQD